MPKKLLLILLSYIAISPVVAQQDAQFSQYMFNRYYLNPAFTDTEWNDFNFIHRTQYSGYSPTFDNGVPPTTQIFSANVPINKYNISAGGLFINDKIGQVTNTQATFSLCYRYKITNGFLSFGTRAGIATQKINFQELRFGEAGDVFDVSNPSLSQTIPDMALGLYYQTNKYHAGIGVNHLLNNGYNYGTDKTYTTQRKHYNLIFGINFDATDFRFSPVLLLKSDISTYSLETGFIATYIYRFYVGANWRASDAISAIVGVYFMKDNRIRLGYAFDYIYSGKTAKSPISHEILLSYRIKALGFSVKSIIRTPRFRHR